MNWLTKSSKHIPLFTLIGMLVLLCSWSAVPQATVEKGYIKVKTRAFVRVYEESVDSTKGPVLYSDWIKPEEYVSLSTERGRIIYNYRYSATENWTPDVHAWCRGTREEAVSIP
ncbi:MAG TPA: hypothetical protein VGA96_04835 [Fibrella sp.]